MCNFRSTNCMCIFPIQLFSETGPLAVATHNPLHLMKRELASFFKLLLEMHCHQEQQLFYHRKHHIPITQDVLIST